MLAKERITRAALVVGALMLAGLSGVSAASDNPLSIGPGKLRWTLTPGGHWARLVPAWDEGRSVITQGGFVVFATGDDGEFVTVASTATRGLPVPDTASNIGTRSEGAAGGYRAPSLPPDDDGDGRVDEDRLDRLDNDNDGRVDEDFAAIGDEMIVTQFVKSSGSATKLLFHVESYAWALPHIDGVIMVSVHIENRGTATLQNVSVGAVFERAGPFRLTERRLRVPWSGGATPLGARALVCTEPVGGALALVALAPGSMEGWVTGHVAGNRSAEGTMIDLLGRSPADRPTLTAGVTVEEDATLFALAPVVENLRPGGRATLDFAFVATAKSQNVVETVKNAVRTFHGDGQHRYLPPPVSLTPRTVWGRYEPIEADPPAIAVTLETLGEAPVSAEDVMSLTGQASGGVERRDSGTGVIEIIVRGETAERAIREADRITLKGRLKSGEIFEAVLRPAVPASSLDLEAERVLSVPGQLAPELLSGSPNPFRDFTTIFYEVPSTIENEDGSSAHLNGPFEGSVKVYGVTGQLVSVLADGQMYPGVYSIAWRAVDDKGNPVASGVYYVRLQLGQKRITKRLILLK